MYVPVSLPLPCFQTVFAHSSASTWLCCCSSSTSCFLGSPLIFIFLLVGLRLSSPPSAAVSGHQWVFFGWKSFQKGLCGSTYSAYLDSSAPTHSLGQVLPCPGCPAAAPGCLGGGSPGAAECTVVGHSRDDQMAAWRAAGTSGQSLQANLLQVPTSRKGHT